MQTPRLALAAALALLLGAPSVLACALPAGVAVDADDAARLERLDTSRMRGLASALASDSAEERGVLASLFAAGLASVEVGALPGRYQCRTIKAGGGLPLVVYSWFRCDISMGSDGLVIRKSTGSQQFSGALYPLGTSLAYRGAGNYGDEAPRDYGDKPDENQVGCLAAVPGDDGRYVLELPEPRLESLHDVIELRRAP